MEIRQTPVAKEDYLKISDDGGNKVFRVAYNGKVWWTVKGELVLADTDKKLGKALGCALAMLVKHDAELKKKILKLQEKSK